LARDGLGWLGSTTGKYRSIRQMENPKFQTRIFGQMESAPRSEIYNGTSQGRIQDIFFGGGAPLRNGVTDW